MTSAVSVPARNDQSTVKTSTAGNTISVLNATIAYGSEATTKGNLSKHGRPRKTRFAFGGRPFRFS